LFELACRVHCSTALAFSSNIKTHQHHQLGVWHRSLQPMNNHNAQLARRVLVAYLQLVMHYSAI